MKRKLGRFFSFWRAVGFYIPFTWYFLLFGGGVAFLCLRTARSHSGEADAYSAILNLLVRVTAVFLLAITAIALLTVLVSYIAFRVARRRGRVQCSLNYQAAAIPGGKSELHLQLAPVLKPLMGFVKVRLQYGEHRYTGKATVVEKKDQLLSRRINGAYHWALPEIREYQVNKVILYFEDLFQFFSLAVPVAADNRFLHTPHNHHQGELAATPRRTEDTETRIEEIRRVEGEWLNYKAFESSDDVRRIVWKIYAKNKELVVRTRETMDPFASHLYLYASFFTAFGNEDHPVVRVLFLNYYKQVIWNTYRQLAAKGFTVKYVTDQSVDAMPTENATQVQHTISTSRWQQAYHLRSFVHTRNAAAVVISSLSDPEEVQTLLEEYGNEITVVFVPLSQSLQQRRLLGLVEWVFVQREKDDREKWKAAWNFHPLKRKMERNEKTLRQMLEQYSKPVIVA